MYVTSSMCDAEGIQYIAVNLIIARQGANKQRRRQNLQKITHKLAKTANLWVKSHLRAVRTGSLVILRSDSQYVAQNYPKLGQWWADGTLDGANARPNADLWLALLEASRPHLVIVEWIRGHADYVEQNHCHDRARSLAIQDAAQAAA